MLFDLFGPLLGPLLIVIVVIVVFESCWRKCPPDKLDDCIWIRADA